MASFLRNTISCNICKKLNIIKDTTINRFLIDNSIVDRVNSALRLRPINKKTDVSTIKYILNRDRLKVNYYINIICLIYSFMINKMYSVLFNIIIN